MEDIWNGLFNTCSPPNEKHYVKRGLYVASEKKVQELGHLLRLSYMRLYTMARQLGVITRESDIKRLANKLYDDSMSKNPQGFATYPRIMLQCMDKIREIQDNQSQNKRK